VDHVSDKTRRKQVGRLIEKGDAEFSVRPCLPKKHHPLPATRQDTMSSNGNSRSWLEGTLDVISVMAPRATTPIRRSQRSMSAPNSPAHGGASSVGGSVARLPSQDSLDCSMHNDSGHGKSTAQIIRDLKQSNARLTARTAALEVDFMNQLNQTTLRFQEKQESLEDSLRQKEKHVNTLESRCKIAETRIREKEEGLGKLKEDSAFQRHTISDLKTQLHQLSQEEPSYSERDVVDNCSLEKQDLMRELEKLKKEASAGTREKLVLKQEVEGLKRLAVAAASATAEPTTPDRKIQYLPDPDESPSTSWKQLEKTQNALQRSESALNDLQTEQQRLSAEHAQRVIDLKEQLKSSSTDWEQKESYLLSQIDAMKQSKGAGDLQSQLVDRDTTIANLREQVLNYSSQLTELTEKNTKIKASMESQEQYRRDEADDLRVLNDAQEEEIDALRKQLDEALAEIEMREQELEEAREQEASPKNTSASSNEQEGEQISESYATVLRLQRTLEETKKEHGVTVSALKQQLDKATVTEEKKVEVDTGFEIRLEIQKLTETVNTLETQIVTLTSEKESIESEYKSQLSAKEAELEALRQQSSAAGESTADHVRQPSSSVKTDQSGGSLEEDLRKEIQTTRQSGERVVEELNFAVEEKETELVQLRGKLEDRDTTISALVKSSVTLEQQISSSKYEIETLRFQIADISGDEGVNVVLDGPLDSELKSEVQVLRQSLAAAKAAEERFTQDLFRVKRQLYHAKKENVRVKTQLKEGKKMGSPSQLIAPVGSPSRSFASDESDFETTQRELQERDDAISNLVNQSMVKEKELKESRTKLSAMSKELNALRSDPKGGVLSTEEVRELRQEAEMFAGQVIEQDEEIEALKNALQARDARVVVLQKEVNELKSKPAPAKVDTSKLMDLEAEIDELKEANEVQRDELRLLRRTARKYETVAERISEAEREEVLAKKDMEEFKTMSDDLARDKTALLKELEEAKSSKTDDSNNNSEELEALRESTSQKIAELEAELKAREVIIAERAALVVTNNVDEMEVEALKEEKNNLERNLSSQSAAVDSARKTIRELEQMLAQKTAEEAGAHEEEKEELLGEIESLSTEVEKLKDQLAHMEEERHLIADFKEKLEQADEAREYSEKTIVDTYERKFKLLNLDKDVTIDKLRKELVEDKEVNAEEQELMYNKIQEYEMTIKELKEEMLAQLEQRETKIYALEHTLHAQEQLVGNMRSEMDHLQGSMETTAVGRREEIEDMQQELVAHTKRAASQEREITSLRMQTEEMNLEHQAEVAKLNENIASMENTVDSADHRSAMDIQMDVRVREVKDRLEKLKWRNQSIQDENKTLRGLLERAQQEIMKERNGGRSADLEQELKAQKLLVNELQTELKIAAAPPAKPPITPTATAPSPSRSESKKQKKLGFLGRRRANSQEDSVEPTK